MMASQSSCHGFCSPGNQDNRLNLKGGTVTVTPDNDSIRVGDTLWLKSVIPTRLTELYVNGDSSTINFSGASNVATDFHLNVAIRSDTLIGGIDSFEYLPVKGHIKANSLIPHAGKTVSYIEDGGSYQFVCGLIAMKKGIYALSYIDIYQAHIKCLFASIQVIMDNPDNHIYYLADAIHYPGSPYGDSIYSIERTHTYCFKVY